MLTELLLAPSATEDFVPVGTHRLGKRFGVRPKPRKKPAENAESTAGGKSVSGNDGSGERKGKEMGKDEEMDTIYTIQIVGGASIAWTESFDKAVAVCDALTLAAKASGFAAKYDVVEVKRWTA